MKTAHCIICGKEFQKDRNYITCGSPECRRQNNLRKQREARKRAVAQREVQKAARLAIEAEKREARNKQLQSRAKPEPDANPLPGWKSPVEIILDQYPREYHRENGESLNVFEMHQALKNHRLADNEIIRLDGQGTFLVVSAGSRQNLARVPGV